VRKRNIIITILSIIIFDLVSKIVIRNTFAYGESKNILGSFLRFTYIENKGIAFGMFSNTSMKFFYIKSILLLVISLVIIHFLIKELKAAKHKLYQIALCFMIGGALGNILERIFGYMIYEHQFQIFYGKVVDFIDIGIGAARWYIFNVADSFVTIGVLLFIIGIFFYKKKVVQG
jgi:signal peptidase II